MIGFYGIYWRSEPESVADFLESIAEVSRVSGPVGRLLGLSPDQQLVECIGTSSPTAVRIVRAAE